MIWGIAKKINDTTRTAHNTHGTQHARHTTRTTHTTRLTVYLAAVAAAVVDEDEQTKREGDQGGGEARGEDLVAQAADDVVVDVDADPHQQRDDRGPQVGEDFRVAGHQATALLQGNHLIRPPPSRHQPIAKTAHTHAHAHARNDGGTSREMRRL
jgi:hypothetical protein